MSRRSYTAKFKLSAVVMAEEVGNRAAAKRLGINEKNVRLWRKDKAKISSQRKSQKSARFSKPHWPEMEEEVNAWVSKKRQSGLPVSQTMVRIEAKKIAKRLHITSFPGSEGWLRRFMKRWNLSNRRRTTLAQRLPEDLQDKVLGFQRYIINKRKTNAYPLSHIGNMDETPCSFDMVGSTTVNAKGEKTVRIKTTGHEKSNFTIVLAQMADGTKLKPMVIFKRKTMPKETIPTGILVHVHPKGWMDEDGMCLWIRRVWNTRPRAAFKDRSLLVLDRFAAHLTPSVKDRFRDENTDLGIIPGGLLQPLDKCINKVFKQYMKELWADWIASGEHTFTPSGLTRRPTITLVCEWIVSAWNTRTVIKSFKKCSISNNLDGS